jgi:hypothetical protein
MRREPALLWILQLTPPAAIVAYALFRALKGPAPGDWLVLTAAGSLVWVVATGLILLGSRALRTTLLSVGYTLWMTAIAWCLFLAVLSVAHVKIDLPLRIWRARQTLLHEPIEGREIGLYASHPRYGWWHCPGVESRHKFVDFDVLYTTGADCFRVTRTPEKPAGEVLCLGCSYTFGHGVEDREPYASILASEYWTNIKVHNAGVNGWGTAQALLLAEDYFANHRAPAVVLYGWIAKHLERNALRKRWLQFIAGSGRKKPCFEIVDDRLVFAGLHGPEDGLADSPGLDAVELDLSVRMLAAIDRICREHGSRFVVVLLPYDSKDPRFNQHLDSLTDDVATRAKSAGLECLDVRPCTAGLGRDVLYNPHDPHPKLRWHKLVARAIAEVIDPCKTSGITERVASKSHE